MHKKSEEKTQSDDQSLKRVEFSELNYFKINQSINQSINQLDKMLSNDCSEATR
jgi:hypothetical protein